MLWLNLLFLITPILCSVIDDPHRLQPTKLIPSLSTPRSPQGDCSNTNCAAGQTCCLSDDGSSPLCCNLPNATCCGVFSSCCPNGYVCDPVQKECILIQNTTTCLGCEAVVDQMVDYGCDAACDVLPPPADAICALLNELGLCQQIINWVTQGFSSQSVCIELGLCSGGTCACGYCTRYVIGRCLSLPNHCPASFLVKETLPYNSELMAEFKGYHDEFCVDGTCDSTDLGCCLNCF
jgi:hypothetical protein